MARRARLALRSPPRLSSSRRLRRAATRANSAATKKALARTRANTAVSPRNTDTVCGGSIPEKVSVTAAPLRVAVPTRLLAVLVVTAVFMVVEAVGGWISGSLALVADAGHMLTDVGALGLSLATAWLARRPADPSKTYGYVRWEILAALVNGAALLGIAAWVVFEAVGRMRNPQPIRTGLFLGVAAVSLVANLVSLWVLHGARH